MFLYRADSAKVHIEHLEFKGTTACGVDHGLRRSRKIPKWSRSKTWSAINGKSVGGKRRFLCGSCKRGSKETAK